MKRNLIVLLVPLLVTGAAAQVDSTAASERMAEVIERASRSGWLQLGVEEAATYIIQVEPFLLDVRTVDEFDDGYIEGAVNVPVTELAANLHRLPTDLDTPILVYCAKGTRSFWAQGYLTALGYDNVQNLREGFRAWRAAGFPSAP